MVSKKIIFILFLTLISCKYNGVVSEYGLPRKKINFFSQSIYSKKIDTLSIYKNILNYKYNKQDKSYDYFEKTTTNSYKYVSYLKFYANGKLGLFIIPKKDTLKLERSFFNPKKAKMGYYEVNENLIKTRNSTIGGVSFFIVNQHGVINGDSIKLIDKNQGVNIYIKKEVSKQLLNDWKPDW